MCTFWYPRPGLPGHLPDLHSFFLSPTKVRSLGGLLPTVEALFFKTLSLAAYMNTMYQLDLTNLKY